MLEGDLITSPAAPILILPLIQKTPKALWNEVMHGYLDAILADVSVTNGWMWLFARPWLALHSSGADGWSMLDKRNSLLNRDFSTLKGRFSTTHESQVQLLA